MTHFLVAFFVLCACLALFLVTPFIIVFYGIFKGLLIYLAS